MEKYDKHEFKKLSLAKRYKVLKEQGEHVAARQIGNHLIHLYVVNGYFVEMWIIFAINQIQWIEVQNNQEIINEYSNQVDLNELLSDDNQED
ncbi:MAG: hypothetical protein WC994_03940 [Brumimicrobium sp.]